MREQLFVCRVIVCMMYSE